MAAVDWRTIRAVDCDLSDKARRNLAVEFGGAVTLGELDAKSDVDLLRTANIGRKTLDEVRTVISALRDSYPAPAGLFLPPAPIDWALLGQAVEFYKSKGYEYVEAPWAVSRAAVDVTCPNPAYAAEVDGLGCLVGSAEQSFLQLDLAGKLPKGRYVALTPCFRLGDNGDALHHPYFMKVELYANVQNEMAFIHMMSHAGIFLRSVLGEEGVKQVNGVKTEEGYDIELNGIEIGSYGIRGHGEHHWTYGTGLAEPRFSQARAAG